MKKEQSKKPEPKAQKTVATAKKSAKKSAEQKNKPAQSQKPVAKKIPPKKTDVKVKEVYDADYAENDEVDENAVATRGPKIYHVAFRKDNRWQVKRGKAAKALKLFNKQEDAIAFAKEIAQNQNGSIVIHKMDGKIRKQRY